MESPFSHNWWVDSSVDSKAFTYSHPEQVYNAEYFNSEHHPNEAVAQNLYSYMQQTYKALFGKYFISVVEIGSGGGEITKQFHDDHLDYLVIEPTKFGVEKLINNGIDRERIFQEDIRFIPNFGPGLSKQFDLVMCTEVAEHIEPWFASKVVESCTVYSNAVWFSAANTGMNPHYHHPNVAPIWAWDNIFAEFGFKNYIELDGRHNRADRLYYA